MKKRFTILIAAIAAILMMAQPVNAWAQSKDPSSTTLNVSSYASANSWENGTVYSSASISPVTFTKNGTGDNGKYYTSNNSWRFYESNSGGITIEVTSSYELYSITFTYTSGNSGVLKDGANSVSSGTEYKSVSGQSKSFTVSHSSGSKSGSVQITSIVVKYNAISIPTHTLTYSATNGSITGVDGESASVTSGASVAEGAKVYLTATPSSASYAFKNWAVTGTGSTLYNVNSDTTAFKMGTADATVTAYFATPHNFSYSASNGSITVSKGRPVATNTPIAEGGVLNISATPTSGYRFKQWNVTGSGSSVASSTTSPTTFTMGTADATLAAEFEAVYTVTYDENGATSGTVPTDATQYTSGTTVTVAANTGSLVKTGYDFGGWNTKADGTGTNYTAGTGTFSITANTTLYAKWDPETYTVAVVSVGSAIEVITAAYASSTIAEGGSASGIAYGTEITLRADGLAAGKGIAWDVYKTGETGTKVTVTDNKFTVPNYNVTISGTVGNVFVKYTGDLAEGDYVVYSNGAAMKNSITSSRFDNQTANISVSGNDMVITNDGTEADVTWHIANISETSNWTMYNADEKKYAGSTSTKNTAALLSSVDDYAKWTYEVDNGVYDFVNYGRSQGTDPDNKFLRKNGDSGWASYATGTGTKPNLYKKTNTYQLDVATVANITNTATPSGQSAIAEGGNAYVKPGVTVTLASTPSADYIIDEWDVYKTGTPATKVTVTSNTFTMPDYAVTVSATTREIEKVDVKYYVNDVLLQIVNVTEGDELTLKTAGEISAYVPSGFTFAGWTDDEEDLSTLYTSTYTPAGATNLYAVFTATKPATFTLVITKDNFTTVSYADNNKAKTTTATAISGETMFVTWTSFSIYQTGGAMQWKSGEGYIYNSTDLGTVTSVTITSTAGSYTTYYGTTAQPSSGDAGTGKGYFKTSVGGSTGTTSRVEVTFVKSVARKFTRVIDEDVDISTTVTLNAPAIIESGQTLTIEDGGILNAGDYLTIEDGGTLIIEDGGQLFCSTSVAATVQKSITGSTAKAGEGWYSIASPVHDGIANTVALSNVTNLVSSTTPGFKYDMLAYDETKHEWVNQKEGSGASGFNVMNKGQGYIYRNSGELLSFVGNTNVGAIDCPLSFTLSLDVDRLKGLNLIGNPYTHSITKGSSKAIDDSHLSEGFYEMTNAGGWKAHDDGEKILSKQGVLVKTSEAVAGFQIKDVIYEAPAKDKAGNDKIKFMVSNSSYEDVAYAKFCKGLGLTKIEHRNTDIPMIYINQDDENYAIATMDDDIKAFSLCFKAKKTAQYTLSCDATGDFSYLHVIDRLTGEDVDMLLEGKYTFIGTPQDAANRFVVRLDYLNGSETPESGSFVYQSGSDVIINGTGELQIFDVTGRMVAKRNVNNVETMSTSSLQTGVYIFRLNEKTQKIVVK